MPQMLTDGPGDGGKKQFVVQFFGPVSSQNQPGRPWKQLITTHIKVLVGSDV